PQRKFRVFGKTAYVSVDFLLNEAQIFQRDAGNQIHSRTDSVSDDFLEVQCAHFLECVRDGSMPLVSGQDGLRALKFTQIVIEKLEARRALLESGHLQSSTKDWPSEPPSF